MPSVQIFIDGQEIDPCEHMTTILERLQTCENALARSLLGLPGTPLRPRRRGSIGPQPRRSDGSGSRTPTFGPPVSVTVEDPDNPGTLIEVPLGSQTGPFPFGDPTTFEPLVNVQEADGTVVRREKVPLDLKLIEALQDKGDNLLGKVILAISKTAALLLNAPEDTISGTLAKSGNTTIRATHLALLLPLMKVASIAGSNQIGEYLKNESDISVLEGDRHDLEEQVRILDQGFDLPFISTSTKAEQAVFDRIRGNLEILRIEEQEEF